MNLPLGTVPVPPFLFCGLNRNLAHHAFRPESPGHALNFPITQTASGPFLSSCHFCYVFWHPEIRTAFSNRSHHITVLDHSFGKSHHRKDSFRIYQHTTVRGTLHNSQSLWSWLYRLSLSPTQVHVIRGTGWLPAPPFLILVIIRLSAIFKLFFLG